MFLKRFALAPKSCRTMMMMMTLKCKSLSTMSTSILTACVRDLPLPWLRLVHVERWTRDRKVSGSTPGLTSINGYTVPLPFTFFTHANYEYFYFTRECSDMLKMWWYIQLSLFIINFLLSVFVKEFLKSINICWRRYGQERWCLGAIKGISSKLSIQGKNNEDRLALVVLVLQSLFTCCCLGNQSQIIFSAIRFFGNGRRHYGAMSAAPVPVYGCGTSVQHSIDGASATSV